MFVFITLLEIVARDCAEEQLASTEKSQPFGQVSDDRDRNAACFRTTCAPNRLRKQADTFLNDYKNIAQNSPLNRY